MAGYEDIVSKVSDFFGNEEKTKQNQKAKQDKQLASMMMERYTQSRTAKEDVKTLWIEYVKLWRGDHWKKNRASWKSQATENISFAIIETMIPLMGDRQPQINYLPQTKDDEIHAKKLNQASGYVWNIDNMQEKMPTILRDMLILGTSIVKMRWDSDKYSGMGEITADVIDPFHFFPDPDATDPYTDMSWCILKTKIKTLDLKRIYGKDVPSDSEYMQDDHNRPTDTYTAKNSRHSSTQATVLECWYKDDEGRMRVCVVSNGIMLDNKESPYETNDFPFIFFYDHKLHGEFWGVGEFVNLKPLQYEHNKVRAMIMDNMIATNNTMIVVDSNSGIKLKDLRNEPGLMVEKQPGAKIERMPPPHIPSHFFNALDMNKVAMQDVSGVQDVSKGLVQGQVSAASAIQMLQEASQTRLRGKLRNVENAIKRMAGWYLVMFRQFYTEPREILLTGEETGFNWIDFNGQDLRVDVPVMDENGQPVIDPITGQPETEERLTDFNIQISSGSSMMMNKSAKYQQNLELYKAGALDIETLLISADIGDSKEIIKRMIQYGVLADPNAPKVNIKQVFSDLGIKVNLNSNDPELIMNALNETQKQLEQVEQQTGPLPGDMNEQMTQANEFTQMQEQQLPPMNFGL